MSISQIFIAMTLDESGCATSLGVHLKVLEITCSHANGTGDKCHSKSQSTKESNLSNCYLDSMCQLSAFIDFTTTLTMWVDSCRCFRFPSTPKMTCGRGICSHFRQREWPDGVSVHTVLTKHWHHRHDKR